MDEDRSFYIYCHTNIINNKKYIGQTCQVPEVRWGKDGKQYLKVEPNEEYSTPHFARAILKYGWDNFTHEILKEVKGIDEANKWEKYYIELFDTTNEDKGYNLRIGGQNGLASQSTKDKMSKSQKERYKNNPELMEYYRQLNSGANHPQYGIKHSQETLKKQSESHKGKKLPEAQKEKIREKAKRGITNPKAKPVRCIETNEVFGSVAEAAKAKTTGTTDRGQRIINQIHGKQSFAFGYTWEYISKEEYYKVNCKTCNDYPSEGE